MKFDFFTLVFSFCLLNLQKFKWLNCRRQTLLNFYNSTILIKVSLLKIYINNPVTRELNFKFSNANRISNPTFPFLTSYRREKITTTQLDSVTFGSNLPSPIPRHFQYYLPRYLLFLAKHRSLEPRSNHKVTKKRWPRKRLNRR